MRGRCAEHFVDDLIHFLSQPGFVEIHLGRQQAHDIPVALALAQRPDGRMVVTHEGVAVSLVQVGLLQIRCRRQDDIGHLGRVGHEQLMDDGEQVIAGQTLMDEPGIRRHGGRVRAEHIERLDRRAGRLAGERRAEAIHVDRPGGPDARRGQLLPLVDRLAIPFEISAGAIGKSAAAHPVLPGDGRQHENGADALAAHAVALQPVGDLDQARFAAGVQPGQFLHVLDRQPGDFGRALRRVVHDAPAQFRPAGGVFREPGFVVQSLADDHMGHAQRQRAVRARPGRDVPVGRTGRARAARVDDHDHTAITLGSFQMGHEMRGGAGWIMSPDEDDLAVGDVVVSDGPARPQGGLDGVFGRRAADGPVELAGAQPVPEAAAADAHVHQAQRAAVAVGQDGLGPVLGDDRPPRVADGRDCLVP